MNVARLQQDPKTGRFVAREWIISDTKICSKCNTKKPISEFAKDRNRKDGTQIFCKSCGNLASKAYRNAHPDRIKTTNRKFRDENKEYWKEWHKEHYEENMEYNRKKCAKYCKDNPEKFRKYAKQYRGRYPEKVKAQRKAYAESEIGKAAIRKSHHKRRAILNDALVEVFSPEEVFKRDGYICQLCGIKTRPDFKNPNHPKYPNLDHIIPLSLGGEHSRRNTQCLCHRCNNKKSSSGVGDQMRMFG